MKCGSSVYYKVLEEWVTKWDRLWITKCDKIDYKVCQGLQCMSRWITKSVRDYKVCQCGLQSASGITKYVKVDYKVREGLQSVTGLQNVAVQMLPFT